MFDTLVTMVGNVLTAPQWRRTAQTGTFMVTFRVAATSRKFVKEQGAWVDGDSLRVRVTCWRRLAENVSVSVQLGDPVVVHGRLYTRDWVDDQGTRRTSFELEADAVGFDLARGVAKFARRRPAGSTDMVEGADSDSRVGGELTEEVDDPGRPADLPADNDLFEPFDPTLYEVPTERAELAQPDPSLPEPGTEGEQDQIGAPASDGEPGRPDGGDGLPAADDARELVGAGSGRGRRARG